MYKRQEEKIFFDEMRQSHNAVAYFSLYAGQSADLALIDSVAMDITPVIADFNKHRLEFVKINSAHGFNQAADYLISHSDLNVVHAIPRDNAGHFTLDDSVIAAAFSAGHCGLFKSWNNVLTETHCMNAMPAGFSVFLINAPGLFAGGRNFSFAASDAAGAFELVLDKAVTNITITVNGMMRKSSAVKLDAANAVRRFYVDAEITVSRLNVNLLDGHAGTGNDGRNVVNNSAFNNAIAGIKSADGVFFYSNNKNNIFEALTMRCANVST